MPDNTRGKLFFRERGGVRRMSAGGGLGRRLLSRPLLRLGSRAPASRSGGCRKAVGEAGSQSEPARDEDRALKGVFHFTA